MDLLQMSLLQMSLTAGLLVIAILLIRAVALNKLPKTVFLILWGVVLCRLLVPVSIPVQLSVPGIFDEALKKIFPEQSASPVFENMIPQDGLTTGFIDTVGIAGQVSETAPMHFSIDPLVLALIWVAGMVITFSFFAVIYFKNYRELRFATLIPENDFLKEWLAGHKLSRSITILQSDRIRSPIAVGIIKPRIILPKSMNLKDEQLLSYVLTHEYYHIKRYDALWKLILVFALCVHWFNPLVWVMFVLINRDLEITCDELVIRRFGTEIKTAYAYALIGMAEQRQQFTPLYNGFSKNAAEERIVSIMKTKKTSKMSLIAACALVFVLIGCVFVVSATDAQPEKTLCEYPAYPCEWPLYPYDICCHDALRLQTFYERFDGELGAFITMRAVHFWKENLDGDVTITMKREGWFDVTGQETGGFIRMIALPPTHLTVTEIPNMEVFVFDDEWGGEWNEWIFENGTIRVSVTEPGFSITYTPAR